MSVFVKRTLIGVAAIVCWEFVGLVALFFDPDLAGTLLLLMGVPIILGLIAFGIAFFVWFPQRVEQQRLQEGSDPANSKPGRHKAWIKWILLGSAAIFFLRAMFYVWELPPKSRGPLVVALAAIAISCIAAALIRRHARSK